MLSQNYFLEYFYFFPIFLAHHGFTLYGHDGIAVFTFIVAIIVVFNFTVVMKKKNFIFGRPEIITTFSIQSSDAISSFAMKSSDNSGFGYVN